MRMRNILIVHETRILRTVLKTYLISELNDVIIFESSSASDAIKNIKDHKYEVVICGKQLKEMDGTGLYKELKSSEVNKDTPLVIVTSTGTKENIKDITDHGIEHYLISPFTPMELREKINDICDPRSWRTQSRLSIPDTKATIKTDSGNIEADVINMNLDGILCDVDSTESFNDIINSTHITVTFPAKYNNAQIKILWCKLLRVNVLNWNDVYFPQCVPKHMRVVWQIVQVSDEDKEKYQHICDKIEEEHKKIEAIKRL